MLELLVLAPGRSGTTSLHALIERLCKANGREWKIAHQSDQRLVTEAAEAAILRRDLQPARDVYSSWTHQVEVSGNNNAFLVPVMKEVFGPQLKVIRLRREHESHLASLATGPRVSPEVWGGYHDAESEYDGPVYWRQPIAPWFGDMSQAEWDALSTLERMEWYLLTLQAWMDRGAELFDQRLELRTEELSDAGTIERICTFLDPSWTKRVAPVHMNRRGMFDYARLSHAQAKEARRLFEKLDFEEALKDPTYLLAWSTHKALEVASDPVELLLGIEENARRLRAKIEGAQERTDELAARLERTPGDEEAFCSLMETLLAVDRAEEAIDLAVPWIERYPDCARALELAAEAAETLERALEAKRLRQRAQALSAMGC